MSEDERVETAVENDTGVYPEDAPLTEATCGKDLGPTERCSAPMGHGEQCWQLAVRRDDKTVFIGSSALLTALYETVTEHMGIVQPDGPDGPYMWCGCEWRSDDVGPNDAPLGSYAVHLSNALHAASVKALQPIVRRVTSPESDPTP